MPHRVTDHDQSSEPFFEYPEDPVPSITSRSRETVAIGANHSDGNSHTGEIDADNLFDGLDSLEEEYIAIVYNVRAIAEFGDSGSPNEWIFFELGKNSVGLSFNSSLPSGTDIRDQTDEAGENKITFYGIPGGVDPSLQASGFSWRVWDPPDAERTYWDHFDEDDTIVLRKNNDTSVAFQLIIVMEYEIVHVDDFHDR